MIAKAFCVVVVVATGMLIGTPLIAAEQAGRLPRIGVLWPGLVDQWNQAFHQGLRENGYVDGTTAVVDIRATGGNYESGPRLAEELIALDPDVIYAVAAALVMDVVDAEKRAGRKIPIVALTWDPVAEGLVASAAYPGGNITGVAGYAPGDFMTKHLQLLKEVIPRLKRVACLIDTTWYKEASSQTKTALARAGPKIGVRVDSIDVQGPDDLERALSEVVRKQVDAMIIAPNAVSVASRARIISFASKQRLPTTYWEEVFTYDGGLMSYGGSVAERYRRAAEVIAKILHGVKPADIPVDYSMRFRLVVNRQTAKALGIRIPESVLIQADEVIK
jgi:putative ABC transport system substrate-binding protein